MSISSGFIARPVATTLLTIGLVLAGAIAFPFLPVSPLPQVDFPVIQVSASLPGADPETMATSVAAPLERQFGRIAGVNEMTSASYRGSTSITLQFDLDRDINARPGTSRRPSTRPEASCRRICPASRAIAR
jgi:multidrug efflux pump